MWQFGPFEFDPGARELRKFGLRIKISPQVAAVFAVLLQRSGELVTREELAEILWPGGVHTDFEGNLNTIIRDARQVLGDSARKPRFIETQFKRGYRFTAPVRALSRPVAPAAPAAVENAPVALPPADRQRSSWLLWLGIAALAAGVLAGGYALYSHWQANRKATLAAGIRQLTCCLGAAAHPSLSPDGRRPAFFRLTSLAEDVIYTVTGAGGHEGLFRMETTTFYSC